MRDTNQETRLASGSAVTRVESPDAVRDRIERYSVLARLIDDTLRELDCAWLRDEIRSRQIQRACAGDTDAAITLLGYWYT